jgi:hypothetical protein
MDLLAYEYHPIIHYGALCRHALICIGLSRVTAAIFFFRQCVGSRTDGIPTVDQSDMRGLVTA